MYTQKTLEACFCWNKHPETGRTEDVPSCAVFKFSGEKNEDTENSCIQNRVVYIYACFLGIIF